MKTSNNNYPKVAILILNWNGWKDTIECLESVFRISYPNYQVVVIDNGSTDGSMEKIKAWAEGKQEALTPEPTHPLYHFSHPPVKKPIPYIEYNRKEAEAGGNPVENSLMINSKTHLQTNPNNSLNPTTKYPLILIQTDANFGFAGGNNVGIRYALKRGFDYVLLLNNDTVVDKDFLNYLVKIAYSDKKIGIIGAKIYFYDKPNVIQSVGAKINLWKGSNPPIGCRELDKGQYDYINKKIDYVSGALMLIKKEVFNKIGLFDEDYFLYVEEVDFCYRASKAEYNIVIEPKAKIWHKVSASSGENLSQTFLYYCFKNRILFLKKNLPNKFFLLLWPVIARCLISCILCIKTKKYSGIKAAIRGILHGICFPPKNNCICS